MSETCPECGQPDNCGDCDHTPVPDEVLWAHEMSDEPEQPDTPHSVEVDLPWDLEELKFIDVGPGFRSSPDVWEQLKWLKDTAGTYPNQEEELGRIFLAAGLLAAKFPDRPFAECLDQAIVWERG